MPSVRLCRAERVTRGRPLPLCQPPVVPVLTLLPPLMAGTGHPAPIRSTVPHPHLYNDLSDHQGQAGGDEEGRGACCWGSRFHEA